MDGLRFLALGDSYTVGEGVPVSERWPVQLAVILRGRGVAVREPEIIATTGWTTDELARAIDSAALVGPYGLVTLLIGVNNQYRGRGLEEYRAEFRALLQRAIGLAGEDARHVLVLSIPDWGVTPFADGRNRAAIGREIDAFNGVSREEATVRGVMWFDITATTRAMPGAVTDDGLHPDGTQYAVWAALVADRFRIDD